MQTLYLLSLLPVAETLADTNSYGFREYRSCADAIQQCFTCLSGHYSAEHILEGDIKACFDMISHEWLLKNIPVDKVMLAKFLKAGYIEQGKFFDTRDGTPQGGSISPVLANMTLDGMERVIKQSVPRRSKVNFVRFADDFIVTAKSEELLRNNIIPAITSFLQERGLVLSSSKTVITNIKNGFDFLGQHIRKYRDNKVRITPSRNSIKRMKENIRQTLKRARGWPAKNLITAMNSRIRGWANYHRRIVAKKTFNKLDFFMDQSIWRWLRRHHPNKSRKWLVKKYWTVCGPSTFTATVKEKKGEKQVFRVYRLQKFSSTVIKRHVKIRGDTNPYNPADANYLDTRRSKSCLRPTQ